MAIHKHSIECEEEQKKWSEQYPNRCKKCNGAGGFSRPGYFDPKYGGEPPSFDECLECLGNGKCPLCGKEFPEEFDWDKDLLPCGHSWVNDPPECVCWEFGPICDNDRHQMVYKETVTITRESSYPYLEEVEYFVCPVCGSGKEWY